MASFNNYTNPIPFEANRGSASPFEEYTPANGEFYSVCGDTLIRFDGTGTIAFANPRYTNLIFSNTIEIQQVGSGGSVTTTNQDTFNLGPFGWGFGFRTF